MYKDISEWFSAVSDSVGVQSPQSIHLDEIKGWNESVAASLAGQGLAELKAFVAGEERSLDCLLVWPLGCSEALDTTVPKTLELSDEPPSLYLLDPDARRLPDEGEEYRYPVDPSDYEKKLDKSRGYYRCFRTPEGIANDWEYERCMYFEVYSSDGVG